MKSIREMYKIGRGPSSSHTMGPQKAAVLFSSENPEADSFKVCLYGSLCKTGKGHGTDRVLAEAFAPKSVDIEFVDNPESPVPFVNTLDLFAYKDKNEIARMRVMSVGGGDIVIEGREIPENREVYPEKSFSEIKEFCLERGMRLSDYAEYYEGPQITEYLEQVWEAMKRSVNEGLAAEGTLPGGLGVKRKAKLIYNSCSGSDATAEVNRLVSAYAFAVSEQNADNGTIVTAPTCGSCGVVPSVMKYMQDRYGIEDSRIVRALAAAGVVGNVVKHNASVSGAECGCQAEIGTACSMAAAALSELDGFDIERLEYAAEIAMEHHIGLTCDPVKGLVQIPCIERNAVAALRAIDAVDLADMLGKTNRVSFDTIVKTMKETGKDLSQNYRETAEGGLAKYYSNTSVKKDGVPRRADSEEYDRLLEFLDKAFGFEKQKGFISMLPKLYKKEYDPCSDNIVICENSKIIAAVGIYPLTLEVAGERLSGMALGNVAVSPDVRSRGYMSTLMRCAVAETDSYDFVVLGGLRQRYERFGFYRAGYDVNFTVTRKNAESMLTDVCEYPAVEVVEVEADSEKMLDRIFYLSQKSALHAVRRREMIFDILRSWSNSVYAIVSDGITEGYFTRDDDCIYELTLSSYDYLYGTLKALLADKGSIKLCIPSADTELIRRLSPIAEQQQTDCWEMFRINNFARVTQAFLRLEAANTRLPDGSITVKIRHDNGTELFELYIRNGTVGVDSRTSKPADIELSAAEASELFFSQVCRRREELSPEVRVWLPVPITLRRADHA